MAIELSKEDRARAIASIERYFGENMEGKPTPQRQNDDHRRRSCK